MLYWIVGARIHSMRCIMHLVGLLSLNKMAWLTILMQVFCYQTRKPYSKVTTNYFTESEMYQHCKSWQQYNIVSTSFWGGDGTLFSCAFEDTLERIPNKTTWFSSQYKHVHSKTYIILVWINLRQLSWNQLQYY